MRIIHAMESRLDGPTNHTVNRSIPMMLFATLENVMQKKKHEKFDSLSKTT